MNLEHFLLLLLSAAIATAMCTWGLTRKPQRWFSVIGGALVYVMAVGYVLKLNETYYRGSFISESGLALILASVLFGGLPGLVLLGFGLRGKRVGDHPHCRKCNFDLFGKPESTTLCNECGTDLSQSKAVVIGLKHRRRWALILACFLLLSAVGISATTGSNLWQNSPQQQIVAQLPEWFLSNCRGMTSGKLQSDVDAILVERITSRREPVVGDARFLHLMLKSRPAVFRIMRVGITRQILSLAQSLDELSDAEIRELLQASHDFGLSQNVFLAPSLNGFPTGEPAFVPFNSGYMQTLKVDWSTLAAGGEIVPKDQIAVWPCDPDGDAAALVPEHYALAGLTVDAISTTEFKSKSRTIVEHKKVKASFKVFRLQRFDPNPEIAFDPNSERITATVYLNPLEEQSPTVCLRLGPFVGLQQYVIGQVMAIGRDGKEVVITTFISLGNLYNQGYFFTFPFDPSLLADAQKRFVRLEIRPDAELARKYFFTDPIYDKTIVIPIENLK